MTTRTSFALLALAVSAVPLSAQISTTDRGTIRDRVIVATGGRVDTRTGEVRTTAEERTRSKVPPGHLPPRGMCRVWIDGVAPGQQPAVTDCATAERNRVANSRVIYGDRESFRGRANGKFKNREKTRECQVRDAVVVDGRIVNACSDDNARRNRGANKGRRDIDDDDEDSDDENDRLKKGDKASRKLAKAARKAAKNDRGRD